MAWYEGTYSCGHEGRVNIIGPQKDRPWKIEHEFQKLCPDCYKKERAEKAKAAEEESKEMELPELSGSEKQVAWANTIRIDFIKFVEAKIEEARNCETYSDEKKDEILCALDHCTRTHTEARYWIDNRVDKQHLLSSMKEYRDKEDSVIPEEVETEIKEEKARLTVSPENVLKSGVVEISYSEGEKDIYVKYIKDSDFMKVVKSLNYKWNRSAWTRQITEYSGNADDRAAELGNSLISNGFTVEFPNDKAKEMAINGSYEKEQTRWIKYSLTSNKLAISWQERNETLYGAAKRLPGAKWSDGCMLVPVEFYKEVIDFAETMGFSFSSRAKSEIAKYKETESRFDVSDVATVKNDSTSDDERIKKSLVSGGTIIEDLKDET